MRPEDQNYNTLDIHESRLAKGLGAQHRNGHFQRLQVVDPKFFHLLGQVFRGFASKSRNHVEELRGNLPDTSIEIKRRLLSAGFFQRGKSNLNLWWGCLKKSGPLKLPLGSANRDKPLGEILR